jgi:carbamoyl-phosphate synthase small subunit
MRSCIGGQFKVALMDCGVKENIVRQLALLGCEVHRTPHNFDVSKDSSFDGIFISNGPGSPMHCTESIQIIRSLLKQGNVTPSFIISSLIFVDRPVFGICMGNLLMAAALDVPIYKLRFGNRAHNQPAINQVTGRCVITSQNRKF